MKLVVLGCDFYILARSSYIPVCQSQLIQLPSVNIIYIFKLYDVYRILVSVRVKWYMVQVPGGGTGRSANRDI